MPGPLLPPSPLIPDWLRPENARDDDSLWVRAARRVANLIGVNDPRSQILNLMMPMVPEGMATAGPAVKAAQRVIKAFHGSPHDFERFSAEKIGTGEGAQAYGHGLYFAENPAVAEEYKRDLGKTVKAFSGTPTKTAAEDMAHDILSRIPRSSDNESNLRRAVTTVDEWADAGVFAGPNGSKAALDVKRAIADNFNKTLDTALQGKTYEVAIQADPAQFLDWDAPLSQQSEFVKEKLKPYGLYGPRTTATGAVYDPPGSVAYDALQVPRTTSGNSAAAADALKQAGIPGIKYLDQGSRVAGEGTRNYVVFPGNEHLIDILKKYGLAAVGLEELTRAQQAQQPQSTKGLYE